MPWEPGRDAKEHLDTREIRSTRKRDRRIMWIIAAGTFGGVVIGLLNLILR